MALEKSWAPEIFVGGIGLATGFALSSAALPYRPNIQSDTLVMAVILVCAFLGFRQAFRVEGLDNLACKLMVRFTQCVIATVTGAVLTIGFFPR
jgi:hypothetical protein